ncbi:hypothetical protein P7C70_g2012, partial [Phenoliferia sp. Uapishka_3]
MSSEILLASERSNVPVSDLFTRGELVGKHEYFATPRSPRAYTPPSQGRELTEVFTRAYTTQLDWVIDLDTPDDDISEIQKEVAILSEMREGARHNITLYHGCYLNGHELWIAMDFASGGSIRTLMKSGPIAEKYIVLIVREVLVALSFLHRQGIIHRDIKAANVLLTQVGKIVLCDFGVAAHLQTNNKRSTFIGTPLWMAPEVITDGKLYDTKADIWSLGVTMYEIATGNPPYFGMEPLRACALIPRSTPAKLEAGPWSPSMREFLAICLQVDPHMVRGANGVEWGSKSLADPLGTNEQRPTAEELSKSKWIKSASKISMVILRELIVRYRSWIQTGGQRASLAGMESLVREDTFDVEDDLWDFDATTDDDEPIEPLGDEPPRSLDAQAAISSLRPPKSASANQNTRNHPLLRLFDAESNPYAQSQPAFHNMPSGFSTMDTVRPMISIPSFEEMDEMAEAKTTKFVELPADLISPSTVVRANPFSWTTNAAGGNNGPPLASPRMTASPRMRSQTPESPWGSSSNGFLTPTESTFPDNIQQQQAQSYPLVTQSPSLPGLATAADRPFPPITRRRADTAPSSEHPYPPLGPGISSNPLPTPSPFSTTHSTSSSSSSSYNSAGNNSLMLSTSSHSSSPSYNSNSSGGFGSSFGGFGGSGSSLNSPPLGNRPFARSRSALETHEEKPPPTIDANRPFRTRKGSDVGRGFPVRNDSNGSGVGFGLVNGNGNGNGFGGGGGARQRTASDTSSRPGGLGMKVATDYSNGLSSSAGPLSYVTPPTSAPGPFDQDYDTSSESPTFSISTPTPHANVNHNTSISTVESFPFPPETPTPPTIQPWPTGPILQPLDYGKLVTPGDVHLELERTLGELGLWLGVVDSGLGRILKGTA